MNTFELRQQHHTLLLVGIGAGDDGRNRLRLARIVWKMRDIGRDVEEIAWLDHRVMLQPLAVPDVRYAAQGVDRVSWVACL